MCVCICVYIYKVSVHVYVTFEENKYQQIVKFHIFIFSYISIKVSNAIPNICPIRNKCTFMAQKGDLKII